jgi:hypothetical protein
MNENELKLLWQSSNEKLELNFAIGKKNTEEIVAIKTQNLLSSMKPIKIFTILVGILWVGFLDTLILNFFDIANLSFLISAGIQTLLTKLTIGVYVYQLVLIEKVDMSEPVLKSQERLASLKTSTLWVTRLLWLQLPVWTTFYWNESMFVAENLLLWIIQGIVTLSFTCLSVWLFFNIKYENRSKKWFQLLFSGKEWQPIIKSMELLEQIDEYKKVE